MKLLNQSQLEAKNKVPNIFGMQTKGTEVIGSILLSIEKAEE